MHFDSPEARGVFFARARFERENVAKLTYEYLLYLLCKSGLSLDTAAITFGMAEPIFRCQLLAEGMSCRQLLEQVRRDICNLSEIAAKLGYSELSAFTRAYASWYGYPPVSGHWRRNIARCLNIMLSGKWWA